MNIENENTITTLEDQISQRESKFFYGWIVIIFSALSVIVSTGLMIGAFPHFSKSFIDEFGWNRTTIGIAGSLALLTRSLASPFTGRLWDKYGPKQFMAPGIIMVSITLLLATMITKPSHYWAMNFAFAVCVTLCGLGPGFYLASSWFKEKRGITLAIVGIGASIGVTILSPLTVHIILKYGWRMTLVIYAIFNIIVIAPLIHLFIKNRPADMNLTPDPGNSDWVITHINLIKTFIIALGITGLFFYSPISKYSINKLGMVNTTILMATLFVVSLISARIISKNNPIESIGDNLNYWGGATFKEAIRHRFFWFLLFGTSVCYLSIISIPAHFVLHIQSKGFGLSQREAGWALSTVFFFGLFGRVLFGYLSDRLHKRLINLCCSIILCMGMIVLFNLSTQTIWLFCVLFGLGYSGITVTSKQVLAEKFGMNALGKLLGIALGVETLFGGIGVISMGITHDIVGTYGPAFKVLVITSGLSVLLMGMLLLKSTNKT